MTNSGENTVERRDVLGTVIKAAVGATVLGPLVGGGMVGAEPQTPKGIAATGYAAKDATAPLAPFDFVRRDVGPTDVQIDILFCGVCHSDIHTCSASISSPH